MLTKRIKKYKRKIKIKRRKTKKGGDREVPRIDYRNIGDFVTLYNNKHPIPEQIRLEEDVEKHGVCYVNKHKQHLKLPIPYELLNSRNQEFNNPLNVGILYLWVITYDEPNKVYISRVSPNEMIDPQERMNRYLFYPCNRINDPYSIVDIIFHNYLAGGREIICGGELRLLKPGHLEISNKSGHYEPSYVCLGLRANNLFFTKYGYHTSVFDAEIGRKQWRQAQRRFALGDF